MSADKTIKDATAKIETMAADTQKAFTDQFERMTRGFEDASTFGQENVDALMKSGEIAAKAAEGLNTEASTYSKKAFDDGVAAAKDLASAKNVNELIEKQTDFAKASLESFVKQATKMNEMAIAASRDAMEPISTRFVKATDLVRSFTA
ncbi:MAG: phasin family protein [Pseudomonadota bacterium]